ncbi:Protein-lysine N-methyltransferase efm6 [Sorochytrium milnesiophthora]
MALPTTVRRHEIDVLDGETTLEIHEDPAALWQSGNGATVWDAGLVLCKWLEKRWATEQEEEDVPFDNGRPKGDWTHGFSLSRSRRVLEIGSGTGIVGMTLAKLLPDAKVTLTDRIIALPLLQRNVDTNFTDRVSVQPLDLTDSPSNWPAVADDLDLIVFSDMLFEPELYAPLVSALERLAAKNTFILFAHERRDFGAEVPFFRLLGQRFFFRNAPDDTHHDDWRSEDIHVFVARRRD